MLRRLGKSVSPVGNTAYEISPLILRRESIRNAARIMEKRLAVSLRVVTALAYEDSEEGPRWEHLDVHEIENLPDWIVRDMYLVGAFKPSTEEVVTVDLRRNGMRTIEYAERRYLIAEADAFGFDDPSSIEPLEGLAREVANQFKNEGHARLRRPWQHVLWPTAGVLALAAVWAWFWKVEDLTVRQGMLGALVAAILSFLLLYVYGAWRRSHPVKMVGHKVMSVTMQTRRQVWLRWFERLGLLVLGAVITAIGARIVGN